jgi:hypothetical protein
MSLFWAALHHGAVAAYGAGQNAAEAHRALRTTAELRNKLIEVGDRCNKAMLVCEALWTLLRDRLGVPEEELVARVNEIDLSDGKLDGKVRRPAVKCPRCGRTVSRRFDNCIYCSEPVRRDPFSK